MVLSSILYCLGRFCLILVLRVSNCVAQRLAQFWYSSLVFCMWVNSAPDIISDVLLEDCSQL